tara:strand:+ start:2370 stop:3125 length:756 start_codon:yes stop_codon:yes gene_type:complete
LNITKKNYFELKESGFSILNFDKSIKSELLKTINIKINKLFKNKYKKDINQINKINDKKFINKFGNVSQRFFDFKTSKRFNELLKYQFKKNLRLNATMHNPTKSNIKFNNELTKKDFSFYWRIVRSDKNDVGKPHNDEQFWNLLDKKELNFRYKIKDKFKIWIPLYGVTKQNCLKVLNKKYFNKKKLSTIKINNIVKPNIDEKWIKKNQNKFTVCFKEKNAILFDYQTIHYAPINKNKKIRISCEATIIIK